jgi:hypothetical protein
MMANISVVLLEEDAFACIRLSAVRPQNLELNWLRYSFALRLQEVILPNVFISRDTMLIGGSVASSFKFSSKALSWFS